MSFLPATLACFGLERGSSSAPQEILIDAFHHAVNAAFISLAFAAPQRGSS